MSVWVDDAMIPARLGQWPAKWSHLQADTKDELHSFARLLGLRSEWFQDHPRLWHYDVTKSVREKAIKLGAEAVTLKEGVRRALAREMVT